MQTYMQVPSHRHLVQFPCLKIEAYHLVYRFIKIKAERTMSFDRNLELRAHVKEVVEVVIV